MTEFKRERVTLLKLKVGASDHNISKMKDFLVKHKLFVKYVSSENAFEVRDIQKAKQILNSAKQGLDIE